MKATRTLQELGQSLWLDYITRELARGGTLHRYIQDLSVTGLTSNPTIFDKAIRGTEDYDEQIRRLLAAGKEGEELFLELALTDLRGAADLLEPVHRRTAGVDGWVSLEVSPLLAYDAERTITAAIDLHRRAERENLFIKIPGTKAGLPAIEECVARGVPINVTLLFSADQYRAQADAYMRGLERRLTEGSGVHPVVGSVASIFVSRWDAAVADEVPGDLRNRLGVAVAADTYAAYRELHESDRWLRLANRGARRQRLLFASTGTKDPDLPETHYVSRLAAPFTVNTMPEHTLLAFAEKGEVGAVLPAGGGEPVADLSRFGDAGVELGALGERLQEQGAEKFEDSWRGLLKCIEAKSGALAGVA